MKCQTPFFDSRIRAAMHWLSCKECRRQRSLAAVVERVVLEMRSAPIPATPKDLHAKLQLADGRERLRSRPRLGLVLTASAAAVLCIVAVRYDSRGGQDHSAIGARVPSKEGPPLPRSDGAKSVAVHSGDGAWPHG